MLSREQLLLYTQHILLCSNSQKIAVLSEYAQNALCASWELEVTRHVPKINQAYNIGASPRG